MKAKGLAALAALGIVFGNVGCQTAPSPAQWFGSETGAAVQAVVDKFAEQGTIDRIVAGVRGNVQNPGMEGYVNVRTSVGVRVVGANGSVQIDTTGSGPMDPNMVPPYVQELAAKLVQEKDWDGLKKLLQLYGPFPGTKSEDTVSDVTAPTEITVPQ